MSTGDSPDHLFPEENSVSALQRCPNSVMVKSGGILHVWNSEPTVDVLLAGACSFSCGRGAGILLTGAGLARPAGWLSTGGPCGVTGLGAGVCGRACLPSTPSSIALILRAVELGLQRCHLNLQTKYFASAGFQREPVGKRLNSKHQKCTVCSLLSRPFIVLT